MVEISDNEREKTDLLIIPNVEKYSTMDFDKAKEIIAEGEKAAREKIEEVKKYKDEEKFNKIKAKRMKKLNAVYIDEIKVIGSKRYSRRIVKQIIAPKLPYLFTKDDLRKKIDRLYNLGFFEKVNYSIKDSVLEINVEEAAEKELKLGFNYNSITRGELFINGTIKGFGTAGSKTSLEAILGKDESLKLQHTQYIGLINKIGVISSVEFLNIEDYVIFVNDKKVTEYNIDLANIDFMAGSFLSDRTIAGVGIKKEFIRAETQIENDLFKTNDINKEYGIVYLKYEYDSMDRKYFPKSGGAVKAKILYSAGEIGNADFTKYMVDFNKSIKINKKIVLNSGGTGEVVYGDGIPENNVPAIGGIYSRQNSIKFWGLDPSRFFSKKIGTGFTEMFYEFSPSRYCILRYNGAALEDENKNIEVVHGGGVGLGAYTAVGPIEFIISKSNKSEISTYINIGFNF